MKGQWFDLILDLEHVDSVKGFSDTSDIAASLKMFEGLEDTIMNGDDLDNEPDTVHSFVSVIMLEMQPFQKC